MFDLPGAMMFGSKGGIMMFDPLNRNIMMLILINRHVVDFEHVQQIINILSLITCGLIGSVHFVRPVHCRACTGPNTVQGLRPCRLRLGLSSDFAPRNNACTRTCACVYVDTVYLHVASSPKSGIVTMPRATPVRKRFSRDGSPLAVGLMALSRRSVFLRKDGGTPPSLLGRPS